MTGILTTRTINGTTEKSLIVCDDCEAMEIMVSRYYLELYSNEIISSSLGDNEMIIETNNGRVKIGLLAIM